mgnify:CR=1 FL=1
MAQLILRYGTLSAGKSLALLTVNHNYISQGKKTLLLKPSIDTRSNKGYIESRIGIKAKCIDIDKETCISDLIYDIDISCILIDEAQFLTSQQVIELRRIVDDLDMPVICYGLRSTYKPNELFEGSQALFFYADKIEELKNICMKEGCNRKAVFNLKMIDDKPVYSGETISIGDIKGKEKYVCVCSKHYHNFEGDEVHD